MNHHLIVASIVTTLIVIISCTSGCIQQTPPNNTNNREEPEPSIHYNLYVDDTPGKNYTRIQDAIDNVSSGGTIYVYAGIYNETLNIHTPLSLIGENPMATILNHQDTRVSNTDLIYIQADNCTIVNFTIQTHPQATQVRGIYIESFNNQITNNVLDYFTYGLYLRSTGNNLVSNNVLTHCYTAIKIQDSTDNQLYHNTIHGNQKGVVFCCGSISNIVYNNTFSNNSDYHGYDPFYNVWYDAPFGNYYDTYAGTDADGDGIGDTPYNITGGNSKDLYPLTNTP